MINKEYVEELTMVYIHSYNKAMNEIRNPSLAVQAAMSVIMAIANIELAERRPPANPLEALFTSIAGSLSKQKEENQDSAEDVSD